MTFFEQIPTNGKILVLDLGFLGDTVHLLPAAYAVREAFPDARLSVMIAQHILPLLEVTPWIDEKLGYPRYPKGPKPWQDWGRIKRMRGERYDAVINLNGSDRSSILTALTGSPLRLGRRPDDGGPWFWNRCFTHPVEVPRGGIPVYRQQMEALRLAGFSVKAPRWEVALPDAAAETANLGRYVHISPFANDDYKELPADVLAQVVDGLREAQPDLALVISCAPTEREKRKLDVLLSQLDHKPDAVFPGNLDLVTFAGVLGRAALHMGADSGALHLAMLAGCPMVGWFRKYAAMEEWVPDFGHSRVLVGEATPGGVSGISASDVVSAAVQLLEQSR